MALTPDSVPSSYEQLFEENFEYVRLLCQKMGIRPQDSEDAAASVLLKFYERDFLSKFDADAEFAGRDGKQRRSTFRRFLSGFVSKYALQERDKQMVRATKEPMRCEAPIGEDGAIWIEIFGPATELDHASFELAALIRRTYAHLSTLPIRGTRDLARAFKMLVEMTFNDGKADRKVIAAEFDVSLTAVSLIIADLWAELDRIGFTQQLRTVT